MPKSGFVSITVRESTKNRFSRFCHAKGKTEAEMIENILDEKLRCDKLIKKIKIVPEIVHIYTLEY